MSNEVLSNQVIEEPKSNFGVMLDMIKNLVSPLDDIIPPLRIILPSKIAKALMSSIPYVIAFGCGFIHFMEALQGFRDFLEAYRDKNGPQRKTRLLTSGLRTLVGLGGVALSGVFVASIVGAAVMLSVSILPIIVYGLLTSICVLSLFERAYRFHQIKKNANHVDQIIEAERELAYSVLDVIASACIVAAAILTTAIIVGSAIGTFGILPGVLSIAGAFGIGIGSLIFKGCDYLTEFEISTSIRNGVITWGKELSNWGHGIRNWFQNKFTKGNSVITSHPMAQKNSLPDAENEISQKRSEALLMQKEKASKNDLVAEEKPASQGTPSHQDNSAITANEKNDRYAEVTKESPPKTPDNKCKKKPNSKINPPCSFFAKQASQTKIPEQTNSSSHRPGFAIC